MHDPRYDVFLSFSGVDRSAGRQLAEELRAHGLQVFLDQDNIEHGEGITDSILDALNLSKLLVAYCSVSYAARAACQHELMTAFVAGQMEGDPRSRVMVINPESNNDHLRPIQLADARYLLPRTGVGEMAPLIAKRAAGIEGVIGNGVFGARSGWLHRGSTYLSSFVGRYRELWDLHSALFASQFPLYEETRGASVGAVSGLPGAGKTALVTTYAWRFAAAHPGGVEWLSLEGAPGRSPRDRYFRELRRIAHARDVPCKPETTLANRLSASTENSLWIIDDIPPEAGGEILDLLPSAAGTRTVLISEDDQFRDVLPVVRVGPMPTQDAIALLDNYRGPDDDRDRAARDHLVHQLGHNAGAITAMGLYLRDRQGLSSYLSFEDELEAVPDLRKAVFSPVRPVLDRMSTLESRLLRIAREATVPLPAAALTQQLPGVQPAVIGAALKSLLHRSAAIREGAEWRLDPYLLRASDSLGFGSRSQTVSLLRDACKRLAAHTRMF